ncbi:hypothetical protein [Salinibaculum rarum]|uniref:hypothetical protein n=1 Tax=Salinibaculum rarum TaxID=3058903 RepID=UPI00265FC2CB|nr:hypothetical protein [Salinibaculum sp. KK48]
MSWTHSSKVVTAALLVVLVGTLGTAAAIDVSSSGAPQEAEVGTEINATITIEDPYQGDSIPSEWTLRGSTELENVSWTIEETDQGNPSGDDSSGAQSFTQELPMDGQQGDQITITIRGDVPAITNYTYNPHENFTMYEIERVTGSNAETLETHSVDHYTGDSREARQAIQNASAAIEEVNGDEDASNRLDQAISAYNQGNFDNAISIASDAENLAQNKQQSQQTTQLLLYAVGALVVIALVGGVLWYWRQQQQDNYKLQ